MSNIIIEVERPEPIDGNILDEIFSPSLAISEAVSKFWDMGLATKAELGKVNPTDNGYQVEILY